MAPAIGVLGLTVEDVQRKLNPLLSPGLILLGADGDAFPIDRAEQIIAGADAEIVSAFREDVRRIFRRVEGEVVVDDAMEGQTATTLYFAPVSAASVALYHNYWGSRALVESNASWVPGGRGIGGTWYNFGASGKRLYRERTRADRMTTSAFSIDPDRGEITFTTPLSAGDTVFADYDHAGMSACAELREYALTLIAARITKDSPNVTKEAWDAADREEVRLQSILDSLALGRRVDFLEQLRLVPEFETSAGGAQRLPLLAGW
jgi:hypothetical protein